MNASRFQSLQNAKPKTMPVPSEIKKINQPLQKIEQVELDISFLKDLHDKENTTKFLQYIIQEMKIDKQKSINVCIWCCYCKKIITIRKEQNGNVEQIKTCFGYKNNFKNTFEVIGKKQYESIQQCWFPSSSKTSKDKQSHTLFNQNNRTNMQSLNILKLATSVLNNQNQNENKNFSLADFEMGYHIMQGECDQLDSNLKINLPIKIAKDNPGTLFPVLYDSLYEVSPINSNIVLSVIQLFNQSDDSEYLTINNKTNTNPLNHTNTITNIEFKCQFIVFKCNSYNEQLYMAMIPSIKNPEFVFKSNELTPHTIKECQQLKVLLNSVNQSNCLMTIQEKICSHISSYKKTTMEIQTELHEQFQLDNKIKPVEDFNAFWQNPSQQISAIDNSVVADEDIQICYVKGDFYLLAMNPLVQYPDTQKSNTYIPQPSLNKDLKSLINNNITTSSTEHYIQVNQVLIQYGDQHTFNLEICKTKQAIQVLQNDNTKLKLINYNDWDIYMTIKFWQYSCILEKYKGLYLLVYKKNGTSIIELICPDLDIDFSRVPLFNPKFYQISEQSTKKLYSISVYNTKKSMKTPINPINVFDLNTCWNSYMKTQNNNRFIKDINSNNKNYLMKYYPSKDNKFDAQNINRDEFCCRRLSGFKDSTSSSGSSTLATNKQTQLKTMESWNYDTLRQKLGQMIFSRYETSINQSPKMVFIDSHAKNMKLSDFIKTQLLTHTIQPLKKQADNQPQMCQMSIPCFNYNNTFRVYNKKGTSKKNNSDYDMYSLSVLNTIAFEYLDIKNNTPQLIVMDFFTGYNQSGKVLKVPTMEFNSELMEDVDSNPTAMEIEENSYKYIDKGQYISQFETQSQMQWKEFYKPKYNMNQLQFMQQICHVSAYQIILNCLKSQLATSDTLLKATTPQRWEPSVSYLFHEGITMFKGSNIIKGSYKTMPSSSDKDQVTYYFQPYQ